MDYATEYSVKSLAETYFNSRNVQLDIVTQLRAFPYRLHGFCVRSKQICILIISWKIPQRLKSCSMQQSGHMDGQTDVYKIANICS